MENNNQQEEKYMQKLFNEYYYNKEVDTITSILINDMKDSIGKYNETIGKPVDINDFYRAASYSLLNIISAGEKNTLSDDEYDFIAKEGNEFLRTLHSKFTEKTGKKVSDKFYIFVPLILCDIVAYENFRHYKEYLEREINGRTEEKVLLTRHYKEYSEREGRKDGEQ